MNDPKKNKAEKERLEKEDQVKRQKAWIEFDKQGAKPPKHQFREDQKKIRKDKALEF